ncbi:MAG: tripartite tricarboxylate transporter substrate binding protein [Burkholderiales bacterium]|nr:tripartite tricarboxylate transporter substrate binding protein [Burkholderiales bacterium]
MKAIRSSLFPALFAALAAVPVQLAAQPAEYPQRPVRLVVPYSAGGSTDTVARITGARLSERLGQQVVIDNRTGAGTIIGTEIVKGATPDGHVLLMATPPLAVNPSLYAKVPYVLERDFVAITNIAASSNLLVVHPSMPANSVKELIALLKANPGKYNYGSSGVGGAGHLAMALFTSMAGVEALHVPYKGGAPAVADLVAGRLNMMMANLTTAQPHIRAGKLRGLGVGKVKRSPLFPEMPTVAEAGLKGYEANNWNGLVAPTGTPRAVIQRLHKEIAATLQEPVIQDRMAKAGLEPVGDTPAEFAQYLKSEAAKWGKVVKTAGIKAE